MLLSLHEQTVIPALTSVAACMNHFVSLIEFFLGKIANLKFDLVELFL